jgi:hypothetical protein
MRFGPLQACSAHFDVEHNGPVRFFPGKVIDYYFRDAAAQVRIDLDTQKISVTKDPSAPKPSRPETSYSEGAWDSYRESMGLMKPTHERMGR